MLPSCATSRFTRPRGWSKIAARALGTALAKPAGMGRFFRGCSGDLSAARAFGFLIALASVLAGAPARGADAGTPEPSAVMERRPPGIRTWLGAHTFLVRDKVMPGFDLRVGKRPLWFDVEASFVWLSEPSRELGSTFLGNHFGAFFMVAPFRYRWFELRAGVGGDFFPLWNIDADAWHSALSLRASAHVRLWPRVEAFATGRGSVARYGGLELRSIRDPREIPPVLFSIGLAWRTR